MDQILKTLEDDATLTPAQLAVLFDKEEGDIRALIKEYEAEGVILGYKTIIDWDKTEREYVTAMIEVKTTPPSATGALTASRKRSITTRRCRASTSCPEAMTCASSLRDVP